MSYPINKQINPNQQLFASGINAPQLQDINAETIKQNSVLNSVSNDDKDKNDALLPGGMGSKKTAIISIPIGLAIMYGMRKFNKACQGSYDDSLIGRINNWGERVGQKYKFIDKFLKKIGVGIHSFKINVIDKIGPLSAFFNARVKSENAEGQIKMTSSSLASGAIEKLKEHLHQVGTLNGGTKIEDLDKLTKTHYKDETLIKIMEICKLQDDKTASQLKKAFAIPLSKKISGKQKYLSDFFPSLARFAQEERFSEHANNLRAYVAPKGETLFGKNISKVILNLIEGLTQGSRKGGIGLGVILAAYFIADSFKRAFYAPNVNGEKRKEFTEGLISNLGWVFTLPLAIVSVYHAGGLQYIGMGKKSDEIKANVEKYREKLEAFNKDAEAGLLSKADYETRYKELKDMSKGYTKINWKSDGASEIAKKCLTNIVNKPLRLLGRTLTIGLERIRPYTPKTESVSGKLWNVIKITPYKSKWLAGWPVRLALCMMVTIPFVDKLFAKGSYLIFGKPAKSIFDEEKEKPEEKSQVQQPQVQQIQAQSGQTNKLQPPTATASPQPVAPAGQPVQVQATASATAPSVARGGQAVAAQAPMSVTVQQNPNQGRNIVIGQPAQNHYLPPKPVVPTRPAQYSLNAAKTEPTRPNPTRAMIAQEPARSYIPSSEPVRVQQEQVDPKLQTTLGQSYAAEKAASRFVG